MLSVMTTAKISLNIIIIIIILRCIASTASKWNVLLYIIIFNVTVWFIMDLC